MLAFTLGALGLLIVYFVFTRQRPGEWLAVGPLVGGALGNLADRMRDGAAWTSSSFRSGPRSTSPTWRSSPA